MSEESNPSAAARRIDEPQAGRDIEAAALRAAVERLQTAAAGDRDTIERVRAGLADLALAIAHAKANVEQANTETRAIEPEAATGGKTGDKAHAGLLDEFEARVAGLIALIGGPAPGEAAEVPTVSHVVSRLRGDEEPGAAVPREPAAGDGVPTVSALGAMLEKLAASMLPDQAAQPAPPNAATTPPLAKTADEAGAAAESEAAVPSAEPEPPARGPILPELDLLTNFARMEATPYLPPEVGTAVIFSKPQEPEPDPGHGASTAAPEPNLESNLEPEPQRMPAAHSEESTTAANAEPADFLLEQPSPVPEAEPADFLLEPLPAAPTAAPEASAAVVPEQSAPPPPVYDPLAPVRALSDAEKIALFS